MKTFTEAFGDDARLQRVNASTDSPFIILNYETDVDPFGPSDTAYNGEWRYNADTKAFEFRAASGKDGSFVSKVSKRVPAAELGLTRDPAYEIAGLAAAEGKNDDSWSRYALTNNDYGGGVGTPASMMAGAADLRRSIGDIEGYENKKGFGEKVTDFLAEKGWMIPAAMAGAGMAGWLPGMAEAGTTAGLGEVAAGAGGAAAGDAASAKLMADVAAAGDAAALAWQPAAVDLAAYTPTLETLSGSGLLQAAAKTGGQTAVTKLLTDFGVPESVASVLGSNQVIGALTGGLLGSIGGEKQAGVTTVTQAPWEPMQPYLLDAAKQAQQNYQSASAFTPEQTGLLSQAKGIVASQLSDPTLEGMRTASAGIFGQPAYKQYSTDDIKSYIDTNNLLSDPKALMSAISKYGADPYAVGAAYGLDKDATDKWAAQQGVTLPTQKAAANPFASVSAIKGAESINPVTAFQSMGSVDPTSAYKSLLTGDVTNPFLKNIAADNFTMANRNLMEQVMPSIASGAQMSGQFGSSRQGIAQGLAASRLNQDVTAANNQMFGNAYQQAQQNMLAAANQLGTMGINAQQQNAANQLATQQFNANLGLQNNAQKLAQMNAAVDWMNAANNTQNTAIKNSLDLANYKNTYANDALNQYTNTVKSLGGLGGSTSTPYYNNQTANALGGAIAGAQLFKNIF